MFNPREGRGRSAEPGRLQAPKAPDSKKVGLGTFLNLIKETKPSIPAIVLAAVLSVGTTGAMLILPLFMKNVVDGLSISSLSSLQSLTVPHILMLAGALVGQALLSALAMYLLNLTGQQIVARLRDRIWKKLLRLKVPYFDERPSGDLVSRVTNDTAIVRTLIAENISGFFTGVISIVGAIALMLVLDWKMTLTMLAAIPLAAAVMVPLGRMMRTVSVSLQDETANLTAALSQTVSEIRLVKASTAEAQEYRNGSGIINRLFKVGVKEGTVRAILTPLMSFVMMALLVLVIGYGGVRVSSGALTAGALVAFIMYLVQVISPMTQIVSFFTQLQKAKGATQSIVSILGAEEERADEVRSDVSAPDTRGAAAEPGVRTGRAIRFEGVTFSYGKDVPAIHDMSFTLEPGEVTALVGPSGAGKTTIFSLIERFYEPQGGRIKLGETALSEIPLVDWRRSIGYVSQESSVMSGTVRENIVYGLGRPVSEEEVVGAAEMAYADEFIRALPHGYDTQVGEHGVKLSGGQRQRIAIARALLRDPSILMLDEATSSLDSESEIQVQRALANLMQGRTTLVIAHRLSTVIEASKILFIERGRLTGEGPHELLLQEHRTYRRYAEHQLRIPVREGGNAPELSGSKG
ncbi:MAG TPA: ABC transporter ATP-binding protein [Spirochaetia bacterium]|nr:ABC transporter ATP-binding protein [Spirochaetia bacterium]